MWPPGRWLMSARANDSCFQMLGASGNGGLFLWLSPALSWWLIWGAPASCPKAPGRSYGPPLIPQKENWPGDGWINVGALWNVRRYRKSWDDSKCGVLHVCVYVRVCAWFYVIFAVRWQNVRLKKQNTDLQLLYSCNLLRSDHPEPIMQHWANTTLLFLHCSRFLCAPHPLTTSSDSTAAGLSFAAEGNM